MSRQFFFLILWIDDVIAADDETHWQHRVSSGFDRLVAFASTELDKTRRSIDNDTVPSSISCNTSPDSGITHSSSNSEAARTFLSTSSTSSQLDMIPISSGSSTSSGNSSFLVHHGGHHHHNNNHLHHNSQQDHLSDSSMKSSHSDLNSLPITLKNCSSPQDPNAIESPPLSDMGLPRTPSPSVNVNTPPPGGVMSNNMDQSNNLKIPLKYQRKSKASLEKHYKKKFCERNWEYDCDEILAYSNSSSTTAADAAGTTHNGPLLDGGSGVGSDQIDGVASSLSLHNQKDLECLGTNALMAMEQQHQQHSQQHKSSKFRPKGKDWDWSMDSNSSNPPSTGPKTKQPTELMVNCNSSSGLATTGAGSVNPLQQQKASILN